MKDFLANELQNRRRNRVIKFTILLIFILIIITTIVLTCVYFYNVNFRKWCDEKIINKEVAQSKVKSITINKDENVQVLAYDKYICILRKKTLEFYNRIGSKEGTIEIDITNAEFSAAGRYLAVCERNGQKICLISGKEKMYENNIEGNITQISVNRNGYLSVVISNTSYKSVVDVFDRNGKEIFKTNLRTARVVDVSISQDSKYLAIAEVDLSGIIIKSSVQIVSMDLAQTNPDEAFINKYEATTGKLIMKIKYQENNRLICMYNDSIDIFYENENKEFVKYDEKKLAFTTINLNNRIVLIEETSSGEYTSDTYLDIVNPNNNKKKQYITSNVAKALTTSENKIAINFGTELHIVNTNGILIKRYKSNSEINNVVMTDNLAAIVYSDNIAIINF
mgnify:FL=1